MSPEFNIYSLMFLSVLIISLQIVGWERLFSIRRLVGMLFLVFSATYLIRPAFTQIAGDDAAYILYRSSTFESNPWPLTIAVCIAMLMLATGYRLGVKRGSRANGSQQPWTLFSSQYPYLAYTFLGLIVSYGYLSLFLLRDLGSMVATPGGSVYIGTTGLFALGDVLIGPALVAFYAATNQLSITLLLGTPWIINRLQIGWSRHLILVFGLALFMVWLWQKRGHKLLHLSAIVIVIVVAFLIIPLININRFYFAQDNLSLPEVLETAVSDQAISEMTGSYSPITGFEQTVVILSRWDQFRYGLTFVYNYVIMPIPRSLWSGKPTLADMRPWVQSLFGLESDVRVGIAQAGWLGENPEWFGSVYGSIGEAYVEFGWPGIVILFFINGAFIGWVEERFLRSRQSPAVVTAYSGIFGMIPLAGRVNLVNVMSTWMLYFGVLVLVLSLAEILTLKYKTRSVPPISVGPSDPIKEIALKEMEHF